MKYFLSIINKLERKRERINRKSINYKKSIRIAIIYFYESEKKQKFIDKLSSKMKKDKKKVDLYPIIELVNAENRYLNTIKIKAMQEIMGVNKMEINFIILYLSLVFL